MIEGTRVRGLVGIVASLSVTVCLSVACSSGATPSLTAGLPSTGGVATSTGPSADSTTPASGTSQPVLIQVPSVVCCRGQTLQAGRYEVPPWLGIPLSMAVPEGWRVLNEGRARLFMLGRGENVQGNPSEMIVVLNATGDTPEATIDAIRRAEQLTAIGDPTEVTIAGFPGLQTDSSALPNPSYQGDPRADIPPGVQFLPIIEQYLGSGFSWTTSSPEARVRSIASEVGEQTLLLYMEAPPDDFDRLAVDAEEIVQSLETIEP